LDAIDPRVPDAGVAAPQTDAIDMDPKTTSAGPILRRASSLAGLRTLAFVLVIAATSLYLLERLEPVLRPLLIAILLSYLFLPAYTWLRRYMRPIFSFLIIAVGITLGLQGLARMVYRDVVLINHNLPRYLMREAELEGHVRQLSKSLLPWLQRPRSMESAGESEDSLTIELSQRIVRGAATAFMTVFLRLLADLHQCTDAPSSAYFR
jgi:AI-2 transport protein TqsA